MSFTAEQKLNAIKREIALRERVFPNRVGTHRMSKEKADYELAIMRAIEQDYAALADKERLI